MLAPPRGGKRVDSSYTSSLSLLVQRASTLLEQLGAERGWTREEVEGDLRCLETQRLHNLRDLRSLSKESWKVRASYT